MAREREIFLKELVNRKEEGRREIEIRGGERERSGREKCRMGFNHPNVYL